MQYPRKELSSKKILAFTTLAIAVLALTGFVVYKNQSSSKTNPGGDALTGDTINYDPPTDEEKAQTKQHKEDLANQPPDGNQPSSPQPTAGPKKQVTPVITVWGQNPQNKNAEVNGYVSGIYEDGGTCTLTLEKDGQQETASRPSVKDAQTTSCGLLTIPASSLSAGNWSATLSYSSASARGTSESVRIGIE